jgi:hypothetical protein
MVAVTYGAARIAAASLASKNRNKNRNLAQPKGKGFFARLFDAMIEARMQQAYREIGMHRQLATWVRDVDPVENKEPPFSR